MSLSRASEVSAASSLPLVIEPQRRGEPLLEAFAQRSKEIDAALIEIGGVLLRGYSVPSIESFQQFAAAFGHPLLSYEFASTPRSAVTRDGVYTSTEYPAHQHIPLHSEQAYTREWPMKIWFHCVTASPVGGETPIADNRAIYRDMPAAIRDRFTDGLVYVRNYGDFDVPWQKVFNTTRRDQVEAFCHRAAIECEWQSDGGLRTRQWCQGIERHPRTGQSVWFNQAHLFHVSNLQREVRETLIDALGLENIPRNVHFADGSAIPDELFSEIRAVLAKHTVMFPWHAGDVLMLDNMLVAHARTPFKGARKVVVAMAEPHGNLT
ncbi:TauD/TfdA family dioxygenase [Steroidobacter flavus]|uniref:TauD/TfdA family dioxygenase n=1 Tax=Steroidobacter flavus TaxID=1842136 RepID=A0ABV8T2I6_9GAMM